MNIEIKKPKPPIIKAVECITTKYPDGRQDVLIKVPSLELGAAIKTHFINKEIVKDG